MKRKYSKAILFIIFIIEEAKETISDVSQGTMAVLYIYFALI